MVLTAGLGFFEPVSAALSKVVGGVADATADFSRETACPMRAPYARRADNEDAAAKEIDVCDVLHVTMAPM